MLLGFPCLLAACVLLPACSCAEPFSSKGRGGAGSSAGWSNGNNGTAGSAAGWPGSGGDGGAASGGPGGSDGGGPGGAPNGGAGSGAPNGGDGGSGAGNGQSYIVYASTDTKLFALDPSDPDLPLIEVGDFDCTDSVNGPYSSMVDIAVDRFQKIWGITGHAVMPLTPGPGKVLCGEATSLFAPGPGQEVPTFYGLTFAPVGVLDPQKEVLVAGNTAGELWSIDADGNIALLGDFGLVPPDDGNGHTYSDANVGKPWELSGDIVFLANDGEPVGFATVRDCPYPPSPSDCSKSDTLIEIDMAKLALPNPGNVTKAIRGKILKEPNCGMSGVVSGSMFGIAAWNDSVFGFSRTGKLVRIDTADASGCLIKNYPQYLFSGAGVTTLAPVDVPPLQ